MPLQLVSPTPHTIPHVKYQIFYESFKAEMRQNRLPTAVNGLLMPADMFMEAFMAVKTAHELYMYANIMNLINVDIMLTTVVLVWFLFLR